MDVIRTGKRGRPGRVGGSHVVAGRIDHQLYLALLDLCARHSIPLSRFVERSVMLGVDLVKDMPSPLDSLRTRYDERSDVNQPVRRPERVP